MNQVLSICGIVLLLSACSSVDDQSENSIRPDFDQITVYSLENLFRVATFNEGDFFSSISQISVSDDNTILVTDYRALKIYLFDEDGAYDGYIGREGSGPGEFRELGTVSLITPDTLHVVDSRLSRISFLAEEDGQWTVVKYLDRPNDSLEPDMPVFFRFKHLYPHPDGYLGRYSNSFSNVDTASYEYAYYSLYDYDLNLVDNQQYLLHKPFSVYVERDQGGVAVMALEEGHKVLYSNTADGYNVSTYTGEKQIILKNITGDDSTSFEFPSKHIPITEEEETELLESEKLEVERSMFSVEKLREFIPAHKGYSKQLITDDLERIWVLTRPFEESDPEWLVYNREGDLLAAAPDPGGKVMQIKNNRMYVSFTPSDDEPSFAVYELQE